MVELFDQPRRHSRRQSIGFARVIRLTGRV
jgi:hypothetical protein